MNPKIVERQPQILRLRLPRNARQTPLRMTGQLYGEIQLLGKFQIQDVRSC
jgi:hypothetical protein